MAKFIETDEGMFLNLDRVLRLKETPDDGRYVAITDDGKAHGCFSGTPSTLFPVIPANPGFVLLRVWFSGDAVPADWMMWVHRTPIIAWRMATFRSEPVTPYEGNEVPDMQAILYPDGQINMPGAMIFMRHDAAKNYDAFLEEVHTRWQKHIEVLAKKKPR